MLLLIRYIRLVPMYFYILFNIFYLFYTCIVGIYIYIFKSLDLKINHCFNYDNKNYVIWLLCKTILVKVLNCMVLFK